MISDDYNWFLQKKTVKPLVAASLFATFINLPTCRGRHVPRCCGCPWRTAAARVDGSSPGFVAAPVQARTIDGGARRPVRGKRLGGNGVTLLCFRPTGRKMWTKKKMDLGSRSSRRLLGWFDFKNLVQRVNGWSSTRNPDFTGCHQCKWRTSIQNLNHLTNAKRTWITILGLGRVLYPKLGGWLFGIPHDSK